MIWNMSVCVCSVQTVTEVLHAIGVIRCVGPTKVNHLSILIPPSCTHARMRACTHAHMHTCTHAHMHTCTHKYTNTPAHAQDKNSLEKPVLDTVVINMFKMQHYLCTMPEECHSWKEWQVLLLLLTCVCVCVRVSICVRVRVRVRVRVSVCVLVHVRVRVCVSLFLPVQASACIACYEASS